MKRILICDDNAACRKRIAEFLKSESIETEEAVNGQEALNKIIRSKEGFFDAVTMDLCMPVMGGLEAAHRIKCLGRVDVQGMPIVAVSGNSKGVYEPMAKAAGMAAYLCKPVQKTELMAILDHLQR